jgi:hypothetical protein
MLKYAVLLVALVVPTAALADEAAPVVIPAQLALAIVRHLSEGGTFASGNELAREIIAAANEPAEAAKREAELRAKIEAELKAKAK